MRLFDPLIPLSSLLERLKQRETVFTDKLVPADDLTVDAGTGHLVVRNGRSTEHPFQPQALQLLAGKLRVPHSYLTRCPPELRALNLNHWLRRQSCREFFLRLDGDRVRAVLSPRYRPVSNVQVAETIRQRAGNVVVRAEVDRLRMLLQVVNGRSHEAGRNDRLFAGMHLRNSEVGFLAVELRCMIYRQICLNGLIMGGEGIGCRKRHVTRADEVLAVLGRSIDQAVEAGAYLPGKFADTRLVRVTDPEPVIGRIAERYGFDDPTQDAILNAWDLEPESTLYGVINALTRAANDRGLLVETREKLQEVGGRIMTLASKGQRWLDQ